MFSYEFIEGFPELFPDEYNRYSRHFAGLNERNDLKHFIERAKPEAIAEARERKEELENKVARWGVALKRLET